MGEAGRRMGPITAETCEYEPKYDDWNPREEHHWQLRWAKLAGEAPAAGAADSLSPPASGTEEALRPGPERTACIRPGPAGAGRRDGHSGPPQPPESADARMGPSGRRRATRKTEGGDSAQGHELGILKIGVPRLPHSRERSRGAGRREASEEKTFPPPLPTSEVTWRGGRSAKRKRE